MPSIYLDHAATTVPRPEARDALLQWFDPAVGTGNPSSAHADGQRLRVVVEEARERAAAALSARPQEIVFTSGGTEADNLAVKGLVWAGFERGRRHLVTTAVEHPAVLDAAHWIATHEAVELTVVPPRPDGTVEVEQVLDAVRDDTALVSVMSANNELGAVNDLTALGTALRQHDVPLHTDAVQLYATRAVDVTWVDALALSAHKFGGPVGVGLLYVRRGVPIVPLHHGGGQDRGVRSGTLAAALAAACAAAMVAARADRRRLARHLPDLALRLASGLTAVDGIRRNGPQEATRRLASHVHVSIDGVDGEALTFALDQAGVRVSAGSACASGAQRSSHVLEACGIEADASIRASLGWTTTLADVDRAVEVITEVVTRLRRDAGGGFVRRGA